MFVPEWIDVIVNELVASKRDKRVLSAYELHLRVNYLLGWFLPLEQQSTSFLVRPERSRSWFRFLTKWLSGWQ